MDPTSKDLIPAPARAPTMVDPVTAYLARLPAQRSRDAMLDSLNVIARVIKVDNNALAGDIPWHQLRAEHVDTVLARLTERYAPATVNRHLSALRGLIKTMLRMQMISADAAARLGDFKSLKNKRPLTGRCLSMAEIKSLFNASSGYGGSLRDGVILALGYCAGLRRSEIAELPVSAFDWVQGTITVKGKGGKIRIVPLPPTAATLLKQWCMLYLRVSDGKPMLDCAPGVVDTALIRRLSSKGKAMGPLTGAGVYKVLLRMGERAKLTSFTPHDLRRTYITELLDRGHDPITVARLAGHDDVKTTMLYDRRPERVARAAADSLNLDVPMPLPSLEELFASDFPLSNLTWKLEALRRLMSEGLIHMEEVALPAFAACQDQRLDRFHGGDEHQRGCAIAVEWLRLRGQACLIEGSYFAGRYDVAAADQSVFIECGNTPAHRVIDCAQQDKLLLLIPFGTWPPRGMLFSRGTGSEAAWKRELDTQRLRL